MVSLYPARLRQIQVAGAALAFALGSQGLPLPHADVVTVNYISGQETAAVVWWLKLLRSLKLLSSSQSLGLLKCNPCKP